jgi:hypothetical protein
MNVLSWGSKHLYVQPLPSKLRPQCPVFPRYSRSTPLINPICYSRMRTQHLSVAGVAQLQYHQHWPDPRNTHLGTGTATTINLHAHHTYGQQ